LADFGRPATGRVLMVYMGRDRFTSGKYKRQGPLCCNAYCAVRSVQNAVGPNWSGR
jgi:hypothetical protein